MGDILCTESDINHGRKRLDKVRSFRTEGGLITAFE